MNRASVVKWAGSWRPNAEKKPCMQIFLFQSMKNRGQEPTSYKQVLQESSVLRAIVQKMLSSSDMTESLARLVTVAASGGGGQRVFKLPPLDWTFLKPHLTKSSAVLSLVAHQAGHSISAKRMMQAAMGDGSAVMSAETLFPLLHIMCPSAAAGDDSQAGCNSETGRTLVLLPSYEQICINQCRET